MEYLVEFHFSKFLLVSRGVFKSHLEPRRKTCDFECSFFFEINHHAFFMALIGVAAFCQ